MTTTSRDAQIVLDLVDIEKVFGHAPVQVHALRGVSLQVRAGELVSVMGPSGSGKSSLLTIAGGLDRPTGGTVRVGEVDLGAASAADVAAVRRRRVGYVFQDYNLIPALTAAENVGLTDLADRFPDQMSGGQAQRVAIARAVVGDRSLILADEPTGALDTETGDAVMRMLRARVDAGAAGVLVTHDARHAAWADRVVFIRDGLIVDDTGTAPRAESLLDEAAS